MCDISNNACTCGCCFKNNLSRKKKKDTVVEFNDTDYCKRREKKNLWRENID